MQPGPKSRRRRHVPGPETHPRCAVIIFLGKAGFAAAWQGGLPLIRSGWILWSIVAFSISGIVFGWRVAPLQKEPLRATESAEADSFDWATYRAKSLQWEIWGALATITPLLAVAMMVLKKPV